MAEDEVERLLRAFDFMGLDPYQPVDSSIVDEVVHAYMILYLYGPLGELEDLVSDREGVREMRQAPIDYATKLVPKPYSNKNKFMANSLPNHFLDGLPFQGGLTASSSCVVAASVP